MKIWDPRFTQPTKSISGLPASVSVCEVHPQAPLLACASPQHAIRVYNLDTEEMLNHIRYHDGFMGQKIGPTKCLAFHPHKVTNTVKFNMLYYDCCCSTGLVGSWWHRWTYSHLLH